MLADEFDASLAPENVRVVDLTNYLCNETYCPPVIGKTLVYRDRHHLTATYVRTLEDELEKRLVPLMEEKAPLAQRDLPGVRIPTARERRAPRTAQGIQEEMQALWRPAFPPAGADVEKRIPAVLECGPAGSAPPFERQMEVQVAGREVIAVRGDWERRESNFDAWRGHLEGTVVRFQGHYQTGIYPIRPVELEGTYEGGLLHAEGTRGTRRCTLQARSE